jgi:hypothetical protein
MSSTWMPRAATSVATTSTRREPLEVARALGLVQVAVEGDRVDAGIVELLGEHLGVGAGAGEDEGLAVAVDEVRISALSRWSITSTRWSIVPESWSSPATS